MKRRLLPILVVLALVVTMFPTPGVYGVDEPTPPEPSEQVTEESVTVEEKAAPTAQPMADPIGEGSVPGTIQVQKTWEDNNDADGLRPSSVWVQLYANEVAVGTPVEITAANGWVYNYQNVNTVDADGVPYNFTIAEEGVAPGYLTTTIVEPEFTINDPVLERITPCSILQLQVDTNIMIAKKGNIFVVWSEVALTEAEQYHIREIMAYELPGGYKMADPVAFLYGQGAASTDISMVVSSTQIEFEAPREWSFIAIGSYEPASGITATGKGQILNIHESVERINKTSTKTWSDTNNQDGIRPTSVQFQLYQNDVPYPEAPYNVPQTLTGTGDTWEFQWMDLPAVDPITNEPYVYHVEEINPPEGYTPLVSLDGMNITNVHLTEKTTIVGQKVWEDGDDQDGHRPEAVYFQLMMDTFPYYDPTDPTSEPPVEYLAPLELNEGLLWTCAWAGIPVNADGMPIHYSLQEVGTVPHYEAPTVEFVEAHFQDPSIPGHLVDGYIVTNTHTPETTKKVVKKEWNDDENRDGVRPTSVTVELKSGVDTVGIPIVLDDTNDWTYTWEDLPVYANGVAIDYSVVETSDMGDYTANVTSALIADPTDQTATIEEFTVTNSKEIETMDRGVVKLWSDNDNQDSLQPQEVEVWLLANDVRVETQPVILSPANEWTYIWRDLPVNEAGIPITYSVEEVPVADYQEPLYGDFLIQIADPDNVGQLVDAFTVENVRVPSVTEKAVEKVWTDGDNQDGLRPTSVEVQLYVGEEIAKHSDGSPVEPAVLNADNQWKYLWVDLPVNANGQAIEYSVRETTTIDGYDAPAYAEAIVSLDFPVVGSIDFDGYTVTNTHTPAATDKAVVKIWDDYANQDNIRPDSVQVGLFIGETQQGAAVTLNATNNWTYIWENMDLLDAGVEIPYEVRELTDLTGDGGYETPVYARNVTIIDPADATNTVGGFSVTNTHAPILTDFGVKKNWSDAENQDGVRPTEIEVGLFIGEDPVLDENNEPMTLTLSEDNNWTAAWRDLPVNKPGEVGQEITYRVQEETIANYEVPEYVTEVVADPDNPLLTMDGVTITNTHELEVTEVAVTKDWEDAEDQDGIRPTSVTVKLLADEEEVMDELGEPLTITLSDANGWTGVWSNLPVHKAGAVGQDITYTVEEELVEGYNLPIYTPGTIVDPDNQVVTYEGFTVTNTHEPDVTEFAVKKVWDDAENQDGIRPASIKVQLSDGTNPVGDVVTLSEDNNWTYVWTGLPVHQPGAVGQEVVYTVEETMVGGYDNPTYEPGSLADPDNPLLQVDGYTITNSHTPEVVDITANKIWEDKDNKFNARPETVTLQLLANGKATGDAVTVGEKDDWTYTWEALPKYADGKVIAYTVEETVVPADYKATYSADGLTITNTYMEPKSPAEPPGKVTPAAVKTGDDSNLGHVMLILVAAVAVVILMGKRRFINK